MTVSDVLLVLHIAFVVVAFGSNFVQSTLLRSVKAGNTESARISLAITKIYTMPALLLAAVSGVLLVVVNDDVGFDAPWVSAALSIVLILLLLGWFVLLPAQRAVCGGKSGDEEPAKPVAKAAMTVGIFHLGFLALLVLMIWKPGQ